MKRINETLVNSDNKLIMFDRSGARISLWCSSFERKRMRIKKKKKKKKAFHLASSEQMLIPW